MTEYDTDSESSDSRSSFSSRSTSSYSSESKSSKSSVSSLATEESSDSSIHSYTQYLTSSLSSLSNSSRSSSSSVSSSSISSDSSLSSLSSSSSSFSSISSSSQSSNSSRSSKSSSSTEILPSSSSSSTQIFPSSTSNSSASSLSSSSSRDHGFLSLPFRGESFVDTSVWSFTSRLDADIMTIYAGTGPNGVILKSSNLTDWETFTTIGDNHAISLFIWANALFIGTQPNGRIYVHNFKSGNEYLFVETEDSSVTSFAEYNGKLFAGTSPSGIVYSFDGIVWKEEHRPYGMGITAMASSNMGLFVFSKGAEGPVLFNGTTWKAYFEKTTDINGTVTNGISVSSFRSDTRGIYGGSGNDPIDRGKIISKSTDGFTGNQISQTNPNSPQFNINSAMNFNSGVAFGGSNNGMVLLASQTGSIKLFDIGSPISKMVTINSECIMVSSGNTLFIAKENIT